jgi:hypothetical protein
MGRRFAASDLRSARLGLLVVVAACHGKHHPVDPGSGKPDKPKVSPPETEADREAKRHALAAAIVPEGSSCIPLALKDENAPRLELAAFNNEAIMCAIDTDRQRLLGPVGCWKVDFKEAALAYQQPAPLPGRGLDVLLDDRCARGYCLPKEIKAPTAKVAHMAWNLEGTKLAVLIGDDVHLFDVASKAHESSFGIRGEKGVTNDPIAIHFVGDAIFIEGADQGPYSAVWMFKTDGTQVGPLTNIGGGKEEKPLSTFRGSFSILDKDRVAVAERGMETLNTYEIATGKRAKLVRKVPKLACKPDEIDAYWHEADKVTDKCKDSLDAAYGHLIGATVIAGGKSFIVVLRGERLGEIGLYDQKTLAEKSAIKLPWCDKAAAPAAKPDKAKAKDKNATTDDKDE